MRADPKQVARATRLALFFNRFDPNGTNRLLGRIFNALYNPRDMRYHGAMGDAPFWVDDDIIEGLPRAFPGETLP